MSIKKNKVHFEFFKFTCFGSGTTYQNTLVLNSPASVEFILTGTLAGVGNALINNIYSLDTFASVVNGTAIYPSNLKLQTNLNELDDTTYKIFLSGQCDLTVIAKYYNENK